MLLYTYVWQVFLAFIYTHNMTYVQLAALDTFYIEIEFNGIWTESREDVFRSAADR